MYAVITTEEYKELIQAQGELAKMQDALLYESRKREKAEKSLKELLMMLTKGNTSTEYGDGAYKWYEIEERERIVEYLNENYVSEKNLQFEKVTEEKTIVEKMTEAFNTMKENTK